MRSPGAHEREERWLDLYGLVSPVTGLGRPVCLSFHKNRVQGEAARRTLCSGGRPEGRVSAQTQTPSQLRGLLPAPRGAEAERLAPHALPAPRSPPPELGGSPRPVHPRGEPLPWRGCVHLYPGMPFTSHKASCFPKKCLGEFSSQNLCKRAEGGPWKSPLLPLMCVFIKGVWEGLFFFNSAREMTFKWLFKL